ncbi:MAG: cell division protein FtsZ [Bacteroidia bacterium]
MITRSLLNTEPDSLFSDKALLTDLKIKIIGIGGAGTNAVGALQLDDFAAVRLAAINTDAQALDSSPITEKLMIGRSVTRGLGAGGEVDIGKAAAESDRDAIAALIGDVDLIILVVGLGGGTGSAAALIVAEVAGKTDALILAFVTLPFSFEGPRRQRIAEEGVGELRKLVHGLIPLPNDVLLQEGEEDTSVRNAFAITDRWIGRGVNSLCAMLLSTGVINLDLGSLRSVFQSQGGKTIFGTGVASCGDYVKDALDDLMLCPLLHLGDRPAQLDRILVNVIGGADLPITRVNEIVSQVSKRFGSREDIVFGVVLDESRTQSLEICVLGKAEMERKDVPVKKAKVTDAPSPAETMQGLGLQSEIAQDESRLLQPVHLSKLASRRKSTSEDQDEFTFNEVDAQRGYFEKTDRNDYKDEDLDVPTYLRRGIKIKLKV